MVFWVLGLVNVTDKALSSGGDGGWLIPGKYLFAILSCQNAYDEWLRFFCDDTAVEK